jgi:hypothetical protein
MEIAMSPHNNRSRSLNQLSWIWGSPTLLAFPPLVNTCGLCHFRLNESKLNEDFIHQLYKDRIIYEERANRSEQHTRTPPPM